LKAPKLKRVLRLDNISLDKTYYTEEGYLVDNPIVTSVGIFEYALPNGGIRRELRLPEHVFDPESLASYEGKPVIITHDAGTVDKDNVEQFHIGTILSKGYRDGDDVRAKIVVHDTDAMQECELRELSLGYNLELDETPGEWNGEPYDAIQTNIRINHLALVENARAGGQARLNVDGRDQTLKGAKIAMSKKTTKRPQTRAKNLRRDSEGMTPENFAAALEEFKSRRAERMAANHPDEEESAAVLEVPTADEEKTSPAAVDEGAGASEQAQLVKDRRDRRDCEGDPSNMDEAMHVIAQQDEDIETLLGVIDALCTAEDEDDTSTEDEDDTSAEDEDDTTAEDEDDEPNGDGDESKAGAINADSIDAIVRTRVKLARIGDRLNMNDLDGMTIMGAKKAIIKKLKPGLRLDGQSKSYVNAAFDLALSELNSQKDTNFQRGQMFNSDSARRSVSSDSGASEARRRMIKKQTKNGGKQ